MSRALVAIGVSKAFVGDGTGALLPELPGASADAQRMIDWATGQGYEHKKLFSDAAGAGVKHQPIYDWIAAVLADTSLERLIIYFSGHGYAPAGFGELLLLTNWENDGNEAINLTASVRYAQRYRVPQISIIADACRTTWNTPTPPIGQLILPSAGRGAVPGDVDRFYATHFGDPAQELSDKEVKTNFGIFSREVLRALNGQAAGAILERDGRRLVTSRSLEDYLDREVPNACGAIIGAKIQFPETIAEWKPQGDVYVELPRVQTTITTRGLAEGHEPASPQSRRITEIIAARSAGLAKDAKDIQSAIGRASFESQMGVSVIGAEVRDTFVLEGRAEHFEENGAWHVRLDNGAPGTTLIQIGHERWGDHWIAVATFPKRIATVKIDERGFSSLNYRPSLNTVLSGALDGGTNYVEGALAEATARLRAGITPDRDRTAQLVDILRSQKSDNPALAIIAAHLCDRVGDWKTILDMEKYEIGGGPYTPYDLLFLSGSAGVGPERVVVGAFPLLARGWSLLPTADIPTPDMLHAIARRIAPSLWTMTTPDGGELMSTFLTSEVAKPRPTPGAIVQDVEPA